MRRRISFSCQLRNCLSHFKGTNLSFKTFSFHYFSDSECGHIDDSSRKKPQPVILPVENSLKSNSDMVLTQNPSKKQTDTLLGTALMTGRRRHPVHRNRS